MWLFTQVGFFSVVSYDDNKAPGVKPKGGKWHPGTGKWGGWWSYPPFVKPKKNPKVMIRARVREDLENLIPYLVEAGAKKNEAKILEWKSRDYPYRCVVTQAVWVAVSAKISDEIDYTNFKDRVKDKQGSGRSSLYMSVWSTMNGAERKIKHGGSLSWSDYSSGLGYGSGYGSGKNGKSNREAERCLHDKSLLDSCKECEEITGTKEGAVFKEDDEDKPDQGLGNLTEVDEDNGPFGEENWLRASDLEWLEDLSAEELLDMGITQDDVQALRDSQDPEKVLADPFGYLEDVPLPAQDSGPFANDPAAFQDDDESRD